jgi:hypothetical protein
MKKILFLLISTILLALQYSEAQKQFIQTTADFTKIEASGNANIYLNQGKSHTYTLEGSVEDIENIKIEVKNGTIHISQQSRSWKMKSKPVNIYLTFKQLESIQANGAVDIIGDALLELGDLNLQASGASDIKIHINAQKLKVSSSGGSDVVLNGKAQSLDVSASGGSDVKAKTLEVKRASIKASGDSDVVVHVKDELSISASGGSDVVYYGNPTIKQKSVSGGADVVQKQK